MSTTPSTQMQSLDLLRERHTFPGPFTFKVIGAPQDDFAARAQAAIGQVVAPEVPTAPTIRASATGRHQALTFVVRVASAEQVLAVYAALKALDGVNFVL